MPVCVKPVCGTNPLAHVVYGTTPLAHAPPQAQYSLGMAYSSGRGVHCDDVKALYWLLCAALGPGQDESESVATETRHWSESVPESL